MGVSQPPTDYRTFLAGKVPGDPPSGLATVPPLAPHLFPFQASIVRWALQRGHAAIFADCGLGKTPMYLEWARHVPGRVLVLAPLGAALQAAEEEAPKFGVPVTFARTQAEADAGEAITIANYDVLDAFDPAAFSGVVLDESSILKAYTGATKRALVAAFRETPFRLCCTATPAPNDHVELGNHAEFLGVMRSTEMLSRWFINDTMQAGKYRLKGHAERDFWHWVASWAVCLARPSDLLDAAGRPYAAEGYDLPVLELREHIVAVDHAASQAETGELLRYGGLNATTLHVEMRRTAQDRARRVAELVRAEPDEAWVLWCNTNYEADAIRAELPDVVEVRGTDTPAEKEARLLGFSRGEIRQLLTKPTIAGFGMNWQHCARMAFVGLSYSYEQLYQALRRSWRFGQGRAVHAHVIIAESEGTVLSTIRRKQRDHAQMQAAMTAAMRDRQGEARTALALEPPPRQVARGRDWTLYLGDAVELAHDPAVLADDSLDFSVFSPPFSNLYIYTASARDMGNTADDAEFFAHFGYLIPALYRATRPGRLCAVHCKNLPRYANRDGAAGLRDFRGDVIRAFESHGWVFHSEVTIWKDPVIEMQRTKAHGLLYKQLRRDASFSRQGMPDYLVVFRKWVGEGEEDLVRPVTHTHENFPLPRWQRYASPVWGDIDQTDVLNVDLARESQDEKHICPLQLGVIRRALELWTNPGDLVCSPFAGIGSEGVVSVELGRRFVGFELKEAYWRRGAQHLRGAESQAAMDLFAELDETPDEAPGDASEVA